MSNANGNDAAVRAVALDEITTGIRDLVRDRGAIRSLSQTTLDLIENLVEELNHASTFFLTKIRHIEPREIVTNLMDGIDDEALQLDYFLYSPFHEAVMDIRATLGVPDLVSTDPRLHEGIRAALNVSVEARNISMRRGAPPDAPRPDSGYITKEVVDLILKHPDREHDVIRYMVDRNLISTEMDVDYLTLLLEEQRPLKGGVL